MNFFAAVCASIKLRLQLMRRTQLGAVPPLALDYCRSRRVLGLASINNLFRFATICQIDIFIDFIGNKYLFYISRFFLLY